MQAFLWTVPTVSRVRDQLMSLSKHNYSHVATKLLTSITITIPPTVLCLVAQSCPTLCNSMDCSLPDPSVHWDSPGKNTRVDWHAFLQGILPNPGIEPRSPALRVNSLPSEPPETLENWIKAVKWYNLPIIWKIRIRGTMYNMENMNNTTVCYIWKLLGEQSWRVLIRIKYICSYFLNYVFIQ